MSRERNKNRLLAELFMEQRRGRTVATTRVFFHEIPGSKGMQCVEATHTVNGEEVLLDESGILYPTGAGWQFFWGRGWDYEKNVPVELHHYGPFESAEHAQGAMLEHVDWEAYALAKVATA